MYSDVHIRIIVSRGIKITPYQHPSANIGPISIVIIPEYKVAEENLIQWKKVLSEFESIFGKDIYESWIKNIFLKKEFHNHVILSAPTRFVRDWVVSRYADKALDIIKKFKKSIERIEFVIDTKEQNVKKTNGNSKNHIFPDHNFMKIIYQYKMHLFRLSIFPQFPIHHKRLHHHLFVNMHLLIYELYLVI